MWTWGVCVTQLSPQKSPTAATTVRSAATQVPAATCQSTASSGPALSVWPRRGFRISTPTVKRLKCGSCTSETRRAGRRSTRAGWCPCWGTTACGRCWMLPVGQGNSMWQHGALYNSTILSCFITRSTNTFTFTPARWRRNNLSGVCAAVTVL